MEIFNKAEQQWWKHVETVHLEKQWSKHTNNKEQNQSMSLLPPRSHFVISMYNVKIFPITK